MTDKELQKEQKAAADEYVAHLAEKAMNEGELKADEQTTWQNILSTLKELLSKLFGSNAKITDDDIISLLNISYRAQIENIQELRNSGAVEDSDFRFSIRTKPAPKKTIKVYKLVRLGSDKRPYALFIDSAEPMSMTDWLDAESPDISMLKPLNSGVWLIDSKTKKTTSYDDFYESHKELFKKGQTKFPSKEAINWATENGMRFMYIEDTDRAQKRFDGENRKYWNLGINGSGTVSTFSLRPGWHAASLPSMRQIGKGQNKDLRDDSFVWVEGLISADVDYNKEAQSNPDKDIPDRIPEDGYYMKATNADAAKSQADRIGWYVAGSFKINRFISDSEAREVIDNWNAEHSDAQVEYDYPRESERTFNAESMELEDDVRFSVAGTEKDVQLTDEDRKILEEDNKRFNENLQKQIDGELSDGFIYELGKPLSILKATGIPNLPIQLKASKLNEKSVKESHKYELSSVKNLVSALQEPVAVFIYGDASKSQNIVLELRNGEKNFIVGLFITPTIQGRKIEINSIRNVFPKDNAEWLNWITKGLLLYGNTKKIKTLITEQRINLADVSYLNLDSVAKVLNNFGPDQTNSQKNSNNLQSTNNEDFRPSIDPEILSMGIELATFHIEAGSRKFSDFAQNMIEDFGDTIRPYLKSFYNGVRDLPEVEEYRSEMDSYDEVFRYDSGGCERLNVQ